MKRLLLTMLVYWSVSMCFATGTRAASQQPRQSVPQQSATLYQAAFKSKGLKGWTAPGQLHSDWSVNRNGVVSSPKAASSELLAPYRLGSIRNFAVQATVKVIGKPSSTATGYGLLVRTTGMAAPVFWAGSPTASVSTIPFPC